MNVADLTAKIKIQIEKEDLGKLSDGLEEVKKKLQEFNRKLKEATESQKESAEQNEKNAEATEEAAKETEKQADATDDLADKTKKATSEMHGYHGIISRIIEGLKKLSLVSYAGGLALEKMYERAGRLATSLRLMSTDFSLDPESLQKWQMMAEQAGVSSDAMERLLSSATEMKRLAVQNPKFLPDALNIAGIRPANYRSPEALMKAILSASLRFKDDQKRMAWLDVAGFKDAAAANLIAKQMAKGMNFDSTYFISNENVEKLNKITVAISQLERLSTSVKDNILAAISDDFVDQIKAVCEFIVDSVKTVEKFIARHGGFKKVISDLGGVTSKVTSVANGFATLAKIVNQFGLFTVVIGGFAVALGVVLKVVDLIVAGFKKVVGMVGTFKELTYGFMAMKIGEMLESGAIPEEYAEDARKAQGFFRQGAGVYQDPKMVTKTLNSIFEWLTGIPAKIASALSSVLQTAIIKGIDYLIDSILSLWAESSLPFHEWAEDTLANRYLRYENKTPEQEQFLIDYSNAIGKKTDERSNWNAANLKSYSHWFGSTLAGTAEDQARAYGAVEDLRKLFGVGATLKKLQGSEAIQAQKILNDIERRGLIDFMSNNDKAYYQTVNQTFNFEESIGKQNIPYTVGQAASKGVQDGMKGAVALQNG